jgi:hypothetical protein
MMSEVGAGTDRTAVDKVFLRIAPLFDLQLPPFCKKTVALKDA